MKKILSIINIAMFGIVALVCPFFVFRDIPYVLDSDDDSMTLIECWHIETFEGGSANRLSSLKSIASDFEADNDGVVVYFRQIDADELMNNLYSGNIPDMISFGTGIDSEIKNFLIQMRSEYSLSDNMVLSAMCGGSLLAIPYQLNALVQIGDGETVYAGNELGIVADYLGDGVNGGEMYTPYQAYTAYRTNDDSTLYGTLRDISRMSNAGISDDVYTTDIVLAQYMGITSTTHTDECMRFLSYIMSDEVQQSMMSIGLISPYGSGYTQSPMVDIERQALSVSLSSLF